MFVYLFIILIIKKIITNLSYNALSISSFKFLKTRNAKKAICCKGTLKLAHIIFIFFLHNCLLLPSSLFWKLVIYGYAYTIKRNSFCVSVCLNSSETTGLTNSKLGTMERLPEVSVIKGLMTILKVSLFHQKILIYFP